MPQAKDSELYALEVQSLNAQYAKTPALYGIEFKLSAGALLGVLGPNGAGKSTLIRSIVGLHKPDTGSIRIFGKAFAQVASLVAYVPQRESVDWSFPIDVLGVVLMGRYGHLKLMQRPTKADTRIAHEAMETLGIAALAKRQIHELSGGQQQRVFLARALAQQAELYLMDEPFIGVDANTETVLVDTFCKLRDAGKTIVVVHHDLMSARQYFDQLLLLNLHCVAFGPTAEVFQPDVLRQAYKGQLNILSQVAAKPNASEPS